MVKDRNLLVLLHAYRDGAIDGDQFARLTGEQDAEGGRPIGERLLALGWVDASRLGRIEQLADQDLRAGQDDQSAEHATQVDAFATQVDPALVMPSWARMNDGLPTLADAYATRPHTEEHSGGETQSFAPPNWAVDDRITLPLGEREHVRVSSLDGPPDSRSRYTRTQLHARGGIGQVWLAFDADLGREVALKELRPEQSANQGAWDRFFDEARITGQLEHPGIVPVYGLETAPGDSRPFYTMRFIRGGTLASAIRDYHKKREAGEGGPLDLAALLNALVAACNAVAYAHSRGIIHRDLKGQNIVLGDFGEVMVLDWGLAKSVGQPDAVAGDALIGGDPAHQATIQGQILGTPHYMSPEQAEGRIDAIDHRADIYGLGAILYEILADRPPHTGDNTADLLRKVCEDDLTSPRSVVPGTPHALDAICLKAMARQPEDRYPSALGLADDIRRWLADQPVSAYRDPWSTRMTRWGRRHRTAVVLSTALMLVSIIGLSVATFLIDRERDEAKLQRDQAQIQRRLARQAVDEMYTRVAEQWLEDRLDPLQKTLLEKAADYYVRFAADDDDDPEIRQERGRAFERLGDVLRKLGRHDEAGRAYRRAVAELEALAKEYPDQSEHVIHLSHALVRLANELGARGGTEAIAEAEALDRRALVSQEAMEKSDPSPARWLDTARTQRGLADLLRVSGRVPEAITAYGVAIDRLEQARKSQPNDVATRQELAFASESLSTTLREQGRLEEAEAASRRSIDLFDLLLTQAPNLPQNRDGLARALNGLGLLARDTKTPQQSEALLRRVVTINERLAEDFPDRPDYRRALARGLVNLGILLRESNRSRDAEPVYRRALELNQSLAIESPGILIFRRDQARCLNNLAEYLSTTTRRADAGPMFREALKLNEDLAKEAPNVPEYRAAIAGVLNNQGRWLRDNGQIEPAIAAFRRAVDTDEALIVADPSKPDYRRDQVRSLNNLGNMLSNLGRSAEAEATFRRAVGRYDELAALPGGLEAPDKLELAKTLSNCGENQRAGKLPGAEESFTRALALFEPLNADPAAPPLARRGLAAVRSNFGVWLAANGRGGEASASYDDAARLLDDLIAAHPDQADYRADLGEVLGNRADLRIAENRPAEARVDLERAIPMERALAEANPRGPSRPLLRAHLKALTAVLVDLGDHAAAVQTSEDWLRLAYDQPGVREAIARLMVRCASRVGEDAAIPEPRRLVLAGSYLDRAASLIGEAIQRGDAGAAALLRDETLAPVRTRDGFKALLADPAVPQTSPTGE